MKIPLISNGIKSVILTLILILELVGCKPDHGVALMDACENGDLDSVKVSVENGAVINERSKRKYGWTPLIGAIFHYKTNVIKYLIVSGADVNMKDENGQTPLMYAIMHGDKAEELVEYLIESGSSIEAKDKYGANALDYAMSNPPKVRLIEIIEKYRAKVMEKGQNSIIDR